MGKFSDVCKAFAELDALNTTSRQPFEPLDLSESGHIDAARLLEEIKPAIGCMPEKYSKSFGLKIVRDLDNIVVRIEKEFAAGVLSGEDPTYLAGRMATWTDVIVRAISDWCNGAKRFQLRRLAAVTSTFYNHFKGSLPRYTPTPDVEPLPPLVTLSPFERWGPHTVNGDKLYSYAGIQIGIVNLPASYGAVPVLWSMLAHEVYGHDVMHSSLDWHCSRGTSGIRRRIADTNANRPAVQPQENGANINKFVEELRSNVKRLSLQEGWAEIWGEVWLEEAAADALAVLSMGPAFLIGMLAWLNATDANDTSLIFPGPGVLENRLFVRDGKPAGEHPPDLLRFHVMWGVVEALCENDSSLRKYWEPVLKDIESAQDNTLTIDAVDADSGSICLSYDVAPLAQDAQTVGRQIVTAQLAALGRDSKKSSSMIQLKPWTQANEKVAGDFAAEASQYTKAKKATYDRTSCSPRHCLAGAMMALYEDAANLDAINAFLCLALDDQFSKTVDYHDVSAPLSSTPERIELNQALLA